MFESRDRRILHLTQFPRSPIVSHALAYQAPSRPPGPCTDHASMPSALLTRSANAPAGTAYDTFAGHIFSDPSILHEALMPAISRIVLPSGRVALEGNRRLALRGDAILRLFLVEEWYHGPQRRGSAQEGWLDAMLSNKNLTDIAVERGLMWADYRSPELEQGVVGILDSEDPASTVEALTGAVWLDSGGDRVAVKGVMGALGLVCPPEARAQA